MCQMNFAQNNLQNELDIRNLNTLNLEGKVKSISETSYLGEKNNGKVVKVEKGWQYDWDYDEIYSFDTLGYLVRNDQIQEKESRTIYSLTLDKRNRVVQITDIERSYSYVYDTLGRIISSKEKMIDTNFPSEKEPVTDQSTITVKYFYNAKNQLIKKERFEGTKKIAIETFTYDDSGNLTLAYLDRFALFEKYSYKYDDNNQLIEYQESDETGIISIEYYLYSNKVKIAERFVDYDDGKPTFGLEYRYENGNEVSIYSSDSGTDSPVEIYTYEFDAHHNWIRKIIYDDEDYYIVERVIEYY